MDILHLMLDQDRIRFTPEGKMAVIDAIEALTGAEDGQKVWQNVIDENPEMISWCDTYRFPKNDATPVVGRKGWEKVELLVFEYMVAMEIHSGVGEQADVVANTD
jgi:hypothetical protein